MEETNILFEDTKCVCGNIATDVIKNNLISVGVCRSCKWMIDNDHHDAPSDDIRKLLKGKRTKHEHTRSLRHQRTKKR
jgi:hypothetical protein